MLTAAIRVMAALEAIGPKMRDAMATEPYFPVEYPKWVDGVLVMVTPDVVVADPAPPPPPPPPPPQQAAVADAPPDQPPAEAP